MRQTFAIVFILASGSTGDALRPIGSLNEYYSTNVPVVGTTIVGMEMAAPATNVELRDYDVVLPVGAKNDLCLNATTRDGRYHATQRFEIVAPAPGPIPLDIVSRIPQLHNYSTTDFAMKLEVRASCNEGRSGKFVPALRRGKPVSNILKLVLSQHLDRGFAQLVDDKAQPVTARSACTDVGAASSTVAFDHVCSLQIPESLHGHEANLVMSFIGISGSVSREQYRIVLP